MFHVEPMIFWNVILTLVVAPVAWFAKTQADEVKRIQILLNITREEYLKRSEAHEESNRIVQHILRLENKIDRIAERREAEAK